MKHKNIKLILNYIIGPAVFCVLMVSIYRHVQVRIAEGVSFQHVYEAFMSKRIVWLIAACVLMLMNWGIEAQKWRISIRPLTSISFVQAFKAIFSGTTVAFFTPNRIGEYIGRMLYVEQPHRIATIPLTVVGSIAQLSITFTGGLIALIYWKWFDQQYQPIPADLLNILLATALILCIIIFTLYIQPAIWYKLFAKVRMLHKFLPYLESLKSLKIGLLLRIAGWSFLRYLVFLVQYWCIMKMFGFEFGLGMVAAIMSMVFFLLAIIPTFGDLMDMGIRLQASLFMIQHITNQSLEMLATSLTIWIVNLVIPALLGSLFLLTIRIFKVNKESIK